MVLCLKNRVTRLINSGIVFTLFTIVTSSHSFADGLETFDATYKAFRYGKELGQATLKLDDLGRNKYRLTYDSKVSLFFLSDKRQEVSLFSLVGNNILPYKYTYNRSGTGPDKELLAEFSPNGTTITLNKEESMAWDGELDNQLYRLDLQMRLAKGEEDLEYKLINYRGEKRKYKLLVMGKEQLDLPFGMLEGIKVKIMRESKKRETFAWFSPELNYQLVRLQQFKEGEEQGDIQLSEFSSASQLTADPSS